jgi:uncharacterized RDD family membrane protein YckC
MTVMLAPASQVAPQPAGFWIRFVATVIDWVILQCATWLLELLILGALFWTRVALGAIDADLGFWGEFNSLEAQLLEGGIYLLLSLPYYVWSQSRFGCTCGKALLGIRVVRSDGKGAITLRQSAVRWVSYLISYLPLGTGFLMAAFHPEKRALHDLIAGTVSIRMRSRPTPAGPQASGN